MTYNYYVLYVRVYYMYIYVYVYIYMCTYLALQTWNFSSCTGGISTEVIKEDGGLYGSQGAELVSMGDQVLPEEGNIGSASSWNQFSNSKSVYIIIICICKWVKFFTNIP